MNVKEDSSKLYDETPIHPTCATCVIDSFSADSALLAFQGNLPNPCLLLSFTSSSYTHTRMHTHCFAFPSQSRGVYKQKI